MALNGNTNKIMINGIHNFDNHEMDVTVTSFGESNGHLNSSIRQTEILRCFAQYLLEKNYRDTYDKLVTESGVVLENHNVAKLRESVLTGDWMEAEEALTNLKIEVNSDDHLKQMQFLILEQRILEAMEDKNFLHGVELLRERLTPMNLNRDRVHHLATCLMYKEIAELHNMACWKGKNGGSREILVNKLQGFIPAQVMLPPKRLDVLFNMAIKHQINKCSFHNSGLELTEQSLLQNHECGKKNFPTRVVQEVKSNKSELWVCKFSPNGQYLAVAGKDSNLDIFSVNNNTLKITKLIELSSTICINFVAWSSDSKKLAACSSEDQGQVQVFDILNSRCICTIRIHEDEPYNCAAFFSDNNKLAVGSLKGIIHVVDTSDQGRLLATVDGYRAQCIVAFRRFMSNYDSLLVADTHRRVREYQFGYDSNGSDLNGQIVTTNDPVTGVSGMIGGFASTILSFENIGTSLTAPTSTSTSSESISVTQTTNTTASTTVSTVSASSNPLIIHHAFSSPGIPNQMFQYLGNSSTSTPTQAWIHNAVPVITSVDSAISGLNTTILTNIIPHTSVSTTVSSTIHQAITSNIQLPYSKLNDETLFEADAPIQSIVLSRNSERLLANLNKVGLCMWHISSKQILQRFVGAEQKKFTLNPSFGGFNEDFVTCGSENGILCFWHHKSSLPIHQVNIMPESNISCVHWNPINNKMVACVNDAGFLFIIGPEEYVSKGQRTRKRSMGTRQKL